MKKKKKCKYQSKWRWEIIIIIINRYPRIKKRYAGIILGMVDRKNKTLDMDGAFDVYWEVTDRKQWRISLFNVPLL